MCVYTHTHIHTHTYIHTHTHSRILLSHKKERSFATMKVGLETSIEIPRILPFATMQMGLELTILSEINQRQTLYIISYMWNPKVK